MTEKNIMTASENQAVVTIGALRRFKCSLCDKENPWVIKVGEALICINCRFNEIGNDALYEPLYSGF